MKKVIVVGGGFTGLVTAYYLAKRGHTVELHEAGERLGGLISSERTPHGLVEGAANGFIYTEELAQLLSELKLDQVQPMPEYKKKRFIFRGGLRRWPLSLMESFLFVVKAATRFLFFRKSMAPKEGETVWNWGLRNVGFSATKYLIAPGLQGIYAGNARAMSAGLILGPFFARKKATPQSRYRGTISFSEGMQAFIKALAQKLEDLGVQIHLRPNYTITSLETPHVVCVSAKTAADVIQKVAPQAAKDLATVEMLPVLSVTAFYQAARQKIEGFGCLFPEDQGFKALGVLSNSYIFENRGPDYSETWIFGGLRSPELLNKTDLEILAAVQTERRKIYPSYSEFSEYRVHRWPQALPHYTVAWEQTLERLQLPRGLYLNGNYLGGIGLSKILARTQSLVETLELPS